MGEVGKDRGSTPIKILKGRINYNHSATLKREGGSGPPQKSINVRTVPNLKLEKLQLINITF